VMIMALSFVGVWLKGGYSQILFLLWDKV
jgi:hypothetical protein